MNSIAVGESGKAFRVDVNAPDGSLDQKKSRTTTNLRAFVLYVKVLLDGGKYYMNPSTERKWKELQKRAEE